MPRFNWSDGLSAFTRFRILMASAFSGFFLFVAVTVGGLAVFELGIGKEYGRQGEEHNLYGTVRRTLTRQEGRPDHKTVGDAEPTDQKASPEAAEYRAFRRAG